jgi:hypothetical protein
MHSHSEIAAFLNSYEEQAQAWLEERIRTMGEQKSGAYAYYQDRVARKQLLSGYDRYLITHFSQSVPTILVVHAGIGFGQLAAALGCLGVHTVGLEYDQARYQGASALRAHLQAFYPNLADNYELVCGGYPLSYAGSNFVSARTVLLFTNVVAGWPPEQESQTIVTFERFDEVILEARLFGRIREDEQERQELLERAARSAAATITPVGIPGYHFYRLETAKSANKGLSPSEPSEPAAQQSGVAAARPTAEQPLPDAVLSLVPESSSDGGDFRVSTWTHRRQQDFNLTDMYGDQ